MIRESLGLPYMGSKRKLSKRLVDKILEENPNCKYVFDLFGGGGAISFEFLQRGLDVHYNDLNTGVTELLKKVLKDGLTDDFFEWIDRETFKKLKKESTWKGGLATTCWSFGNNQRNYLYSKENELIKKIVHNIIVYKCEKSKKELFDLKGIVIDNSLLEFETIKERRLKITNFMQIKIKYFALQHLTSIEKIEDLQVFQRLQHLENLENTLNKNNLKITNQSYKDVIIETPLHETVVYLDPPYKNTSKYASQVNHNELINFIINSPYKVYISEYNMDLPIVLEINHKSSFSTTLKKKQIVERLFCNKEKTCEADEWN